MTEPIQTCDDCGLPIPVCNMNAVIRRCVEACGPDALKASPEVQAIVAEAVEKEREQIVDGLMYEASVTNCAEDAAVVRDCARLVEADFSYDEAERLATPAPKARS